MEKTIEQAIEFLNGYLQSRLQDEDDISLSMAFSNSDNYIWISSRLETLRLVLKGLKNAD